MERNFGVKNFDSFENLTVFNGFQGKLSVRMEVEGNIWREAWENAKPVPARRQKRLFDDTKEAEKVLQYLSALKPSEAAHMLIPVLQHASLVRILNETQDEDSIPQLSPVLQVKTNFSKNGFIQLEANFCRVTQVKPDFLK